MASRRQSKGRRYRPARRNDPNLSIVRLESFESQSTTSRSSAASTRPSIRPDNDMGNVPPLPVLLLESSEDDNEGELVTKRSSSHTQPTRRTSRTTTGRSQQEQTPQSIHPPTRRRSKQVVAYVLQRSVDSGRSRRRRISMQLEIETSDSESVHLGSVARRLSSTVAALPSHQEGSSSPSLKRRGRNSTKGTKTTGLSSAQKKPPQDDAISISSSSPPKKLAGRGRAGAKTIGLDPHLEEDSSEDSSLDLSFLSQRRPSSTGRLSLEDNSSAKLPTVARKRNRSRSAPPPARQQPRTILAAGTEEEPISLSDDEDSGDNLPPPAQVHPNLQSTTPNNKWSCQECTFQNDPLLSACELCQTAKPAARATLGTKWSCQTCTFENESLLSACEMCGTAKPKKDDANLARSSSSDEAATSTQPPTPNSKRRGRSASPSDRTTRQTKRSKASSPTPPSTEVPARATGVLQASLDQPTRGSVSNEPVVSTLKESSPPRLPTKVSAAAQTHSPEKPCSTDTNSPLEEKPQKMAPQAKKPATINASKLAPQAKKPATNKASPQPQSKPKGKSTKTPSTTATIDENAPPESTNAVSRTRRSTRSTKNNSQQHGVKQQEVATEKQQPTTTAKANKQSSPTRSTRSRPAAIKQEEESQLTDVPIKPPPPSKRNNKRFKRTASDVGSEIIVKFPKAFYHAFIVMDLENNREMLSADGLRLLIQWKDGGKRDEREEIPLSSIDREWLLSPPPNAANRKRSRRQRNKPDYYALAGLKEEDDDSDTAVENSKKAAKPTTATHKSKRARASGPPSAASTRGVKQESGDEPPAESATLPAKESNLKEAPEPASGSRGGVKWGPNVEGPTKSSSHQLKSSSIASKNLPVNSTAKPDDGIKETVPKGDQSTEAPTKRKPRYPHAKPFTAKVNRYMPSGKPKPKHLYRPPKPEIGNVVWLVDDKTFYSREDKLEELCQNKKAKIVGESFFAFGSPHERLLQLKCMESGKYWYVTESEIGLPHITRDEANWT